ncbi:MAG: nucleoside 2-deoxyribosyltransferase domain-containing protein [Patescibacteria group bacterium]|jgi:hypothetical protein|nr:nucleoside 2-deoxyribosyltransferase domain-containing protein [Patescibacteria group bacterium]
MPVLTPPRIKNINGPLVFLAGPIQGGPNWQQEVILRIKSIDPTVNIASPRFIYPPETFDYYKQLDWETYYLKLASETGVIAFYLANQDPVNPGPATRPYAQTTRFELGEWVANHISSGGKIKIVIGIENGFSNARYIKYRITTQAPKITIIKDDIDMFCYETIELAANC